MVLNCEDAFEVLRGVPIFCWVLVSVVLLSADVRPAGAVHEFKAYRMQHFDLHGIHYGSRSALVNMEVRSEVAAVLNRKCIVIRWSALSSEKFLDIIHRGAGAILILLPSEWRGVQEEWYVLEQDLLSSEVPIPVYFALEGPELAEIQDRITDSAERNKDSSVAGMLISTISEYGYQIVTVEQKEPVVMKEPTIFTVVGKLTGQGLEQRLPTITLVVHYDAMGVATSLSRGVDSNGSGVAALLELARLFSRLYGDPKQRPKYNLLFVLSGGGKLNYFGTKSFLEDQLEDPDSSLLLSADYTLCLDSLSARQSQLFLHVSKPPREDSRAFQLVQALNQSAQHVDPDFHVNLVHKKIRLSEDLLAWEHERFSLKKLPAATLSGLRSPKDLRRKSMFVDRSDVDVDVLARNVRVIAEGLARHMYNLSLFEDGDAVELFSGPDGVHRDSLEAWLDFLEPYVKEDGDAVELFLGPDGVHRDSLEAWLDFLALHPRSPQLLIDRDHPIITGLEEFLSRYVHEVTRFAHQPDKNDPEFVLYNLPTTEMYAYRVKPAVFDLFLAIAIGAYAVLWYFSIMFFPLLAAYVQHLPFPVKVRTKMTKND